MSLIFDRITECLASAEVCALLSAVLAFIWNHVCDWQLYGAVAAVWSSAGLGDREITGSDLGYGYCAPRSTQPSVPPGRLRLKVVTSKFYIFLVVIHTQYMKS